MQIIKEGVLLNVNRTRKKTALNLNVDIKELERKAGESECLQF